MKLLSVENHMAPYRDGTLKAFLDAGYELSIFSEKKAEGQFNHSEWKYTSPLDAYREYTGKKTESPVGRYRKGFLKKLRKEKPDAVCSGSMLEGFLTKHFSDARFVYQCDCMQESKNAEKGWHKAIYSFFVNQADALFLPGHASERFFRRYLKKGQPVCFGVYKNDPKKQAAEMEKWRGNRTELRREFGISEGDIVFLFVGKLIPSRHIESLLNVAGLLEKEEPGIRFFVIGNGDMEENVKSYLKEHRNLIHVPEVPFSELEKYYALADAYVHPGEEPYSLALYEAAVAGMPIVACSMVGATADVLKDGENGFLFEMLNEDSLKNAIEKTYQAYAELQSDAKTLSDFIIHFRGVDWAADQLAVACGFKGAFDI